MKNVRRMILFFHGNALLWVRRYERTHRLGRYLGWTTGRWRCQRTSNDLGATEASEPTGKLALVYEQ
jgi:hypothetical protein